jgi:hypothetical protein
MAVAGISIKHETSTVDQKGLSTTKMVPYPKSEVIAVSSNLDRFYGVRVPSPCPRRKYGDNTSELVSKVQKLIQ